MFMQLFHTLFHSGGLPEDLNSTFLGKLEQLTIILQTVHYLHFCLAATDTKVSLLAAASLTTQLQHIIVHKFPLATWCANIKISEKQSTLLYKNLTSINCGIGNMQALRLKDLRKRNDQATGLLLMCANITSSKNTTCERRIHEKTKHAKHLTCHQIT